MNAKETESALAQDHFATGGSARPEKREESDYDYLKLVGGKPTVQLGADAHLTSEWTPSRWDVYPNSTEDPNLSKKLTSNRWTTSKGPVFWTLNAR